MKRNKYLLLGSSIGVLLLLAGAAAHENFLKEWRRIQVKARSDEGEVAVQLRQIVNPGLGVSDRCVSCHVAMAPGEQSVRGDTILTAHKPVVHDPAEYGCTVCHGGQGQATEKADAHGEVHFWPEPMIPKEFSYAGCGRCHATLGVPEQEQLQKAQLAFERLDCLACHRVDGRGGTIRPEGGGMEGPDLSSVGLTGYDSAWHDQHVRQAEAGEKPGWKNAFQSVAEQDRALLKTYLDTRVAAPRLVAAKSVFFSQGCLGCHKVSGVGGDDGPDLSRAGEKDPGQVSFRDVPGDPTMKNWMAEHFLAPASVVVGSQMPPVPLSSVEIDQLTMYTLSLRRKELRDLYVPKDRVRAVKFGEREFATDGATLYGAFCSGCHGLDGMGRRLPDLVSFPSIANPDFLALASDDFLAETIRNGRPGRRMPGWLKDGGLRPDEIQSVVSHIRSLSAEVGQALSPRQALSPPSVQSGKRIFDRTCAGCHGQDGKGGEGPALNNKVLLQSATDTYLVETIRRGRRGTTMASFLDPSPVRPTLTETDIDDVVAYLRSFQGKVPSDEVRAVKTIEREAVPGGAALYAAFCAGCHGADGMGQRLPGLVSFPSIANPDFLVLVSDEFLAETIKKGRPGRQMPPWMKKGGPLEIQAVIAHIRELGGQQNVGQPPRRDRLARRPGARNGKETYDRSCAGCHGPDGKGGEAPALNNEVLLQSATDTYLFETIRRGRRKTAMPSFLDPSPVHPTLAESDIDDVVAYLRSLQGVK